MIRDTVYLEPFCHQFADEICHWFANQKESLLWGGRVFGWPLQPRAMIERSRQPNLEFYILTDEQNTLGFIELEKVSEIEMRLCRVIVAPGYRGRGLGKTLVQLALAKIKQCKVYQCVTLSVFTENQLAYNCYKSLGFNMVDKALKFRVFSGEKWPLIHMEIILKPVI